MNVSNYVVVGWGGACTIEICISGVYFLWIIFFFVFLTLVKCVVYTFFVQ